jgi:hypothetical protein
MMSGQPEPWNGAESGGGSRRRIWVSLVVLYISAGFLLTFTMRPQWIMPDPGHTDFLDAMINPRIYLSALFWPFWLISSLF